VPDNADEKILARAQEIKAERGISLTDAMIRAEDELAPKPTVPGCQPLSYKWKDKA